MALAPPPMRVQMRDDGLSEADVARFSAVYDPTAMVHHPYASSLCLCGHLLLQMSFVICA